MSGEPLVQLAEAVPRPTRRQALLEQALLLDERLTRRCTAHLHTFVREAWPVLERNQPFADNWHIGAICEHLEACTTGQIKTLVINVPPGFMKSYLVTVLWPAWRWARNPGVRFFFAAHDQSLSTRDALRVRDLVNSPWFQARWGKVQLRHDQNTKTRYDTTEGGWRISTTVGAGIGEHPHVIGIDDPNDPERMHSDPELRRVNHWYNFTLGPRGAGMGVVTVLIQQRLSKLDLSQHLLDKADGDTVLLKLPMRFEPAKRYVTVLGWTDPRTEPGELLWPERFTEATVTKTEKTRLGSWGTASQHQQEPVPEGGDFFQRGWLGQRLHALPQSLVSRAVRFWDVAGTEGGDGPQTAGVRMVRLVDDRYVFTDCRAGRWGDLRVDTEIRAAAKEDGVETEVCEEQEGGSAGKAVIAARKRRLAGYVYSGEHVTGDKVTRARTLRVQAEALNVWFLVPDGDIDPPWVRELVDELCDFPHGKLKDRVDASSGAFNVLAGEAVSAPRVLFDSTGATDEEADELEAEVERLKAQLSGRGNGHHAGGDT